MDNNEDERGTKKFRNLFSRIKEDGFIPNVTQLKPFQETLLKKLVIEETNGMCVVPTGMGKTICIR